MREITEMTALELSERIRNGEFSAVDAAEAYLDRIEKLNPVIHAYNTVCRDSALRQAASVQEKIRSGELTGRLAGVPIAVKDNICTKEITTTCSSQMLKNYIPVYDAAVIEKLKAEGMIILGKTNMDEFAMGSTGETSCFSPAVNPWDTRRSAGGSSSGSAAAVAAGLAPISLGSDTGGSVRQPASLCGVTGLKPTYSSVSRYGLISYASSLDQIGVIAKDAEDCAALYDIICAPDSRDMTCTGNKNFRFDSIADSSLEGRKICIISEGENVGLSPVSGTESSDSVGLLRSLGATVSEVQLPELKYAVPAYYVIACAEASSNLARYDGVRYGCRCSEADSLNEMYIKTRTEGFGTEVKRRLMLGSFVLSSGYYDEYYKKAVRARQLISEAVDRLFEQYDFIVSPVTESGAPLLGESLSDPLRMYRSDIYTVTANLAGIPAIAVPCGTDKDGMPAGIQLMGRRFSEAELIGAAVRFQQASDFHKKSPAAVREGAL